MGAARARVLGFSNLELVAETAIDIVMPAIDTSIDHDAFAQQLRRANSSATLSPTVFLKRRSITQRKSLGKLLDNVVNRSIEVIKSPLKMHRARTQSFKSKQHAASTSALPSAVRVGSSATAVTFVPAWSDSIRDEHEAEVPAPISLFDEKPKKAKASMGPQLLSRKSSANLIAPDASRKVERSASTSSLPDLPLHMQRDVQSVFHAFAATRPSWGGGGSSSSFDGSDDRPERPSSAQSRLGDLRHEHAASNIIEHFPWLADSATWGSSDLIREAFSKVLKLYFRPSPQQLASMLTLVGPPITDLVRGRWAASLKSQHGSSILACFRAADDDGSGEIDINEFVDAVSEAKLDEAHARALFDKADKDGSGTLDVDEFVALVSSSAVLVNAFADILKAAAERRQRLEEQRLSTFFKQPPAISPTSGMRRRPSLSDMRNPHDVRLPWDAVLAPTAQGLVMGRV